MIAVALVALAIVLAAGDQSTLRQRDRAERADTTFEAASTQLRKYFLTPRSGHNAPFSENAVFECEARGPAVRS